MHSNQDRFIRLRHPKHLLAAIVVLSLSLPVQAQTPASFEPIQPVSLRAVNEPFPLRLPALVKPEELGIRSSTIQINFNPTPQWGDNCTNWPAAARSAVEYAAQIWEIYINSAVTISLDACWADNLGAYVLGHGGALSYWYNFPGAPRSNTFYPSGLANSYRGSDLDPSEADMYIALSSSFSWYTNSDGNTPYGQYDLASVVLHEIAHGLGFLGAMQYSGGLGGWGYGYNMPMPYDLYSRSGSGHLLIDTGLFANPSYSLGSALTSGDIYFHGPSAVAANNNQAVKLYAPATWSPGSSYAHLDTIFNGTINSLMTYAISDGASQHNLGPVLVGMMEDLGWSITVPEAEPTPTATATATATPTTTPGQDPMPTPVPTATPTPAPTVTPTPNPSTTPNPSLSADLAVQIPSYSERVLIGQTISYELVVSNSGPDRASSVVLTNLLPEATTFLSATSSQGSCTQTGGSVNCSLGDLNNLGIAVVQVKLVANAAGTQTVTVTTVGSDKDPDLSNNSDSFSITVATDNSAWLPDLSGSFLGLKRKRDQIRARFLVTNQGLQPSARTRLSFYLSKNRAHRRSTLLRTVNLRALAAGEQTVITATIRLRNNVAGRYLLALIDPRNSVSESDEDNNLSSVRLTRRRHNSL